MKPALRAALVAMPLFLGGCANNPDPYRVEGDAAMQIFRYDDAARAYAQYLEISPGQPEIRAKYGRALLAAGRPLDAAEQFRIAVAQAPNNDQYLDELCESLLRADKRDDLFALLRTNCSQRGRVSDHIRLGRFSQRMGDGDTARTALISAARIDAGRTAAPQIALYDFYASIGERAEAMRRLRMAYYVEPKSTDVAQRIAASGAIPGPTFGLPPGDEPQ